MSATVAARDDPSELAIPLTERVTGELGRFLDEHAALLLSFHPDLALLADAVRAAVLAGGKRLRPTFAYWGWRCVQPAGLAGEAELVRAAASLELLQACALVHDDVMDSSATRRGQPAAHVRFGAIHREHGWPGSPETFGRSGAILLGDVLLSWAEEMFTGAISLLPPARAAAAERQFDLMRTEVVAGQFLDVLAQTRGAFDPDEALRVIHYKTSKYTVQRPLLLGAEAAGAGPVALDRLASYGYALGEAYQLRDDLLGVFGDPAETGKPAGDDLREGKRTLLVALAAQSADAGQRQLLESGVGNPALTEDQVGELRAMLRATGARDQVERRIAERSAAAADCLAGSELRPDARQALLELAHTAAHRSF
ncbi:MAG: polyprenyl synthetase family protein [Actinomycetota bacterium]|nr:polyprenyl synthetase family protein [Actinomycetota bacterium]